MMDQSEVDMHIKAGLAYGEEATCGTKINYAGESSAIRAASFASAKYEKDLEAYPCAFCDGWHIGRAMTDDERKHFS
jgi:hypothetical protein